MKTASTLKSAAATVAAEIARIKDHDADLRQRHIEAQRELDRIAATLPPRAELIANAVKMVDFVAADPLNHAHPPVFVRTLLVTLAGQSRISHSEGGSSGLELVSRPGLPSLDLTMHSLAGMAPELTKSVLTEFLARHAPEDGIPSKDLPARVAKQAGVVRAIEDEHEALVDMAAEAGMTIQHLDAVKTRRDQAARRAQLDAEARQVREAAIDAANARNTRRG